ncbi:hypothetical protein WSK_3654 [Novosphingobium sp. Rr 2-17]|uniref:murein hydrolase activator EnvC family protein n=1 Tax=Novosphingobium sp. Rr 2-17 TaxID=555793 RepID=UPI0002697BBC|nr:peptidoglycan DD-metalloendopeptidase family protein [Novosphingobium sp. Rr 2-17]EIZ77645.1 hypothetical protein WSK_3654 [Novosphingobium sp. Rr 2-17]
MNLVARSVLTFAALGVAVFAVQGFTQSVPFTVLDPAGSAVQARRDMQAARAEGAAARRRAEALEAKARAVGEQAQATAREAAAVAARIQETEAAIAQRQAAIRLIAAQRAGLRATLAQRQEPLARLTASLQRLSRRPPLLALLRPGSVRDAVYMRAMLDTMLPEVERRTADLRVAITRGQALESQARAASVALAQEQGRMRDRRRQLATIEAAQRLAGREASGIAARESDRALALAEKARDLGDLVTQVGEQGRLRDQLAALPGPIMRPPLPQRAQVIEASQFAPAPAGMASYMLPVTGRVLSGFGEQTTGQTRAIGITLAPRPLSQAVAPAAGRIAFAGAYRGFDSIVIIEHAGGWTSLVTGLARVDVAVGDQVVAGSPIGLAGPRSPRVLVELRRQGVPVNPLQYIRSL